MDKISELRAEFEKKLTQIADLVDLDRLRVDYLGKKGSITALLKNMKALSNEEKKTFGAEINKLKGYAAKRVDEKIEELRKAEIEREIAAMPQFDITAPANTARGSYHPITLVQRQCEVVHCTAADGYEVYFHIKECFASITTLVAYYCRTFCRMKKSCYICKNYYCYGKYSTC